MNYKDVIISEARDLHHPGLCLVTFGASPESTPPVQVFHPDRAKRVSGRGVFVGESLHFNMLIFNELQRRHYKRSEGPRAKQLSFRAKRGNSLNAAKELQIQKINVNLKFNDN